MKCEWKRIMMTLMTMVLMAVFAGTGMAQDAGSGSDQNAVTWFFTAIGPIGWIILFVSVIAFAIIIEHFVNVKREKIAPPDVIEEVEVLFEEEAYDEALEFCEQHDVPFSRVIAAGIQKIGHSFETIEKAFEEMTEEEAIRLHQKVGWLSLIAGIAPMLGLLGTVVGMVGAFNTIADAGETVKPADFADSISQALLTTVLGLVIAIPVTSFFVLFRNRVVRITLEIGAIAEELFDRFRGGNQPKAA